MRIQLEVHVWRGTIAESRHRIQAVLCTPQGETVLESGDPGLVTSFRSSAKPFQALPLVERGHFDALRLGDEHLAIMCASHTGSAYHLGLVREILARGRVSARDLACGFHVPQDPESRVRLERHPRQRSRLYNNCSGKHAGMLCLARAEGWPIRGYDHVDHPLQQLMKETIASLAGVPSGTLGVGIDGCGAATFGLPLTAIARSWARLAVADPAGDPREAALARIRQAMSRHPVAVGGEGELSTQLMQISGGRWTAKGGAEGLQCLAIPERGLGLVLKAEDGQARGLGPATCAVLDTLGLWGEGEAAQAEAIRRPTLRNHAGAEVGRLEAAVRHLTAVVH